MAIQPTPPIQLDPSMDRGHELAFINQNFNNIASVLSQNSFVIVQSGNLSLTQATIVNPGAGLFASDSGTLGTMTHNLGYIPAFWTYIEFSTGVRTYLPFQAQDTTSTATARWTSYYASVSTTDFSVQYRRVVYGMGSSTFATPVSAKYYLLQQTAN